jgi:hypothetical protein
MECQCNFYLVLHIHSYQYRIYLLFLNDFIKTRNKVPLLTILLFIAVLKYKYFTFIRYVKIKKLIYFD